MVARKKAGRKTATRKLLRKKATRKKKPSIGDVDSSTQVEAFQILTDRLAAIYMRADERAGQIGDEMRQKLEGLEQELSTKIDEITGKTCNEIEDLLVEVDTRNEELKDRVLTGEIVHTQ